MVHAYVDYGFTELHGTRYDRSTGITSDTIELGGLLAEAMITYSVGEPSWNPPPKIHYAM